MPAVEVGAAAAALPASCAAAASLQPPLLPCSLLPKPIFIISDCTGESAARTVRAGLGQFELAFKMSCPANLVVFRFLNDPQRAYDIIAKVGTGAGGGSLHLEAACCKSKHMLMVANCDGVMRLLMVVHVQHSTVLSPGHQPLITSPALLPGR